VYLTKRQSQLLDFLRSSIAANGYAPSLEEIAAQFQLSSVGTVHKHLKALEDKGVIRRQWNRSRAIEVVGLMDGKARRLPLLGRVAAGQPIEAVSSPESIVVPEDMIGRGPAYVLQVKGDSLRDAAIADGDYVVVEQREQPRDGETVVALVDGDSVTLKRYHRQGDMVRLEPANAAHETLVLPPERVRVQGVVVGVMRRIR
jgi:repressor LexA